MILSDVVVQNTPEAIVPKLTNFASSPGKSVLSLLDDLGCSVELIGLPDRICGYVEVDFTKSATGFVVVVNKDHPRTRQRFSVLHELYHICKDFKYNALLAENKPRHHRTTARLVWIDRRNERLADQYASDLLVSPIVLEQFRQKTPNVSVEEAAVAFGASAEVIRRKWL